MLASYLLTKEDTTMRIAKTIILTVEERITLLQWSRGKRAPVLLVLRAKIVLAATAGRRIRTLLRK